MEDKKNEKIEAFDLDLDTLADKPKRVKFMGEAIEVPIPDVRDLFKMADLLGDYEKIKDTDTKEVIGKYEILRTQIDKMVPDIKGKTLNFSQVVAITDLLVKSATPADISELEKRGITLDTDEKKILLDQLEKSQDLSTSTVDTQ